MRFAREWGDVVYVQDVADALDVNRTFASTLLAKAVLGGKVATWATRKAGSPPSRPRCCCMLLARLLDAQ